MKRTLFILWLLFQISTTLVIAQNNSKLTAPNKVKVYYFHTEERCPIDQSVEENTKKLMQSTFQEKIKDGTIDFRIINTDDKANSKLVSNFEINAQALYVVRIEKGTETKNDLTKFAFDYGLSNPLKFKKGLKDEIEKMLK